MRAQRSDAVTPNSSIELNSSLRPAAPVGLPTQVMKCWIQRVSSVSHLVTTQSALHTDVVITRQLAPNLAVLVSLLLEAGVRS